MTRNLRGAALGRVSMLTSAQVAGKTLAVAVPAILILIAAPAARAQHLTGERLYQICRDRTSPEWREAGHWICPSYIRGIIDGARLQALRDAGGSIPDHTRSLMICDPPTATGDEAINLVVRFLEARPDTRPLPAAVIVFQALGAAWPCRP